eukprot:c24772_g2_i2 orf=185-505(-)
MAPGPRVLPSLYLSLQTAPLPLQSTNSCIFAGSLHMRQQPLCYTPISSLVIPTGTPVFFPFTTCCCLQLPSSAIAELVMMMLQLHVLSLDAIFSCLALPASLAHSL